MKMTTRLVIGIIGDIAAGLLILAPSATFYGIVRPGGSRSVEDCTPYPFLFTLLNSIAFVFYGLVAPMARLAVLVVNSIGILIEGTYCLIYIWYAVGKSRIIAIVIFILDVLLAGVLLALHFTFFANGHHHAKRDIFLGIVGAATGIMMYLAPIRDLVTVAKTKDVSKMSIWLALASLVNGAIWMGYACLHPVDYYILAPNLVGVLSAIAQVLVFLKYHDAQPHGPRVDNDEDGSHHSTSSSTDQLEDDPL